MNQIQGRDILRHIQKFRSTPWNNLTIKQHLLSTTLDFDVCDIKYKRYTRPKTIMPRIVVFESKENRDPDILQSTETKMQSQTRERDWENTWLQFDPNQLACGFNNNKLLLIHEHVLWLF